MHDSYLDQRFRHLADALDDIPRITIRISPQGFFLLAMALDQWLCLPASIPESYVAETYFDSLAERIFMHLQKCDARCAGVADMANKWPIMAKSEGGRKILKAAMDFDTRPKIQPIRRDFMIDFLLWVIDDLVQFLGSDEIGVEDPHGKLSEIAQEAISLLTKPIDGYSPPYEFAAESVLFRAVVLGNAQAALDTTA